MPNDPVAKGFIQVGLTGGINKKQDPHQLQNGQMITADNVIFGAVEGQVTKRYGCASINPQGAPLQGGPFKAIGIRDNIEPIILGANTLNKYNIAQNLSTSIPTGTQGRIDVSQVVGSTGQSLFAYPPTDASTATDGNQYACVVWEEPNATGALMFYGVQDLISGAWIIQPTAIVNQYPSLSYVTGLNTSATYTFYSQMAPKVVYSNGYFYISLIWCGTGNANPYQGINVFYSLPLTNLAGGLQPCSFNYRIDGATTANSSTSPNPNSYDFSVNGSNFILAQVSRTNTATVFYNAGTLNAGQLQVTQQGSANLTISGNQRIAAKCNGPAAFPYIISGANTIAIINAANSATVYRISSVGSPQAFPVDCIWLPNGNAVCLAYNSSASYMQIIAMMVNPISGAVTKISFTGPLNTFYMQILSRMFTITQNSKVYAWIGAAAPSSDTVYNSAFLIEFDFNLGTAMVVCRTLYLKSVHVTGNTQTFPTDVIKLPNSSQYVTFLTSTLEKTADGYHSYGALNRVQFDFAPARGPQILPMPTGGNVIAGAYPLFYDGVIVTEAGFSSPPSYDPMLDTTATSNAPAPYVTSASSGLAGGTSAVTPSGYVEYYYVVCLVRRDAYGNVYRSAPSTQITVQCPNAFNNVYFAPTTYNGAGNVQVEYYRSTQGTPGSHYFLAQKPNGSPFTDFYSDGSTAPGSNNSITKNRLVYTDAGELPNDPPPPVYHAALSDTRMYIIPSDARNTVWASKLFSPGRTIEFYAGNTVSEGLNSGLFTAISVLDDKVIVFKADAILYFYGSGPDNAGNGGFSAMQKLTTDVGCIDPASIAIIPDGILFRSRRGIELLNRSLQVTYVGSPIEPLLKTLGNFASTVVVPRFMQVRFVPLAAGQPVLVFDYGHGRWSTFSNMAAVNAHAILGGYWWISQDGSKVYQETPDAYTDDGQPIVLTLETPEIPVGAGGVQGWGRAYRMALLGDFYTAHTLNVSFAYDHSPTYTDAVAFSTATGLINGDAVYQFRCSRLPRSVMQTLRIKITESGTVGQSCAISSLALEVGSKNGLAKLAAQKTI